MIYMEPTQLGWQPLVTSWMEQEYPKNLSKASRDAIQVRLRAPSEQDPKRYELFCFGIEFMLQIERVYFIYRQRKGIQVKGVFAVAKQRNPVGSLRIFSGLSLQLWQLRRSLSFVFLIRSAYI